MWQRAVAPWIRDHRLKVIGIVQEQHPDRAALYCQWRRIDWPIAVDSLNTLGLAVVPVMITLDESGVIRHRGLRPEQLAEEFMGHHFAGVPPPPDFHVAAAAAPKPAQPCADAAAWMAYGDGLFHADRASEAIAAFQQALCADPHNGPALFRLGVAHQRRSESDARRPDDAQTAVDSWLQALATDPNQYIWRRRIQQYGPRLDKPYDFYSWIEDARRFIRASGQVPVLLTTEPAGSEVLSPRATAAAPSDPTVTPDPDGRIARDRAGHVEVVTRVTPFRVQPGQRTRAQITLRLADPSKAVWNNEAAPLSVFLSAPPAVRLTEGVLSLPRPTATETTEERIVDFEMIVLQEHNGEAIVPGYALFNICEKRTGKCYYLRKDFDLRLKIDPTAPPIR